MDDIRHWQNFYVQQDFYWILPTESFHHDGYKSPWWPGSTGFDSSGNEWLTTVWYLQPEKNSGAVSKMAFTGVTRDVNGSVLGSCVVKLYKTSDSPNAGKDTLLYEVTSDATTGAFIVYTPFYPDTHYMVSYKAGSPDVEGTTVNTLIGA